MRPSLSRCAGHTVGIRDMSRFPQVFGSQSLRQLEKRLVALEVGLLQRGRATRRNHIKSPHQYY